MEEFPSASLADEKKNDIKEEKIIKMTKERKVMRREKEKEKERVGNMLDLYKWCLCPWRYAKSIIYNSDLVSTYG